MSQQAAKRRRSQAKKNFTHMPKQSRPHYAKSGLTVQAMIARNRVIAARMASASTKKK